MTFVVLDFDNCTVVQQSTNLSCESCNYCI